MNSNKETPEELIRLYLLGELEPDSRQQFEETLMVNETAYEELLMAEDELIDRYLSGGLGQREQEKFLQHFLITPERHQKLEFARSLRVYVTNNSLQPTSTETEQAERPAVWTRLFPFFKGRRNPALGLTFTAAMLALVLLGSWLAWRNWRQPESRRTGNGVLLISLSSNVTRSEGTVKPIIIPPDIGTVQFKLEPAVDDYESYRAILLSNEGVQRFRADALKAEKDGAVMVSLPAETLTAGDYRLKLDGIRQGTTEGAGTYYFTVANK